MRHATLVEDAPRIAIEGGAIAAVRPIADWARNVRLLPFHFGMSEFASASCLLELGHDDPELHRIGFFTAVSETVVGFALELDRSRVHDPVKRGTSGRLSRVGGLLSGQLRSRSARSSDNDRTANGDLALSSAWPDP